MKLSHLIRTVVIGVVIVTAAGLILVTDYSIKESFFPQRLSSLETKLEHAETRLKMSLTKLKELILTFADLPPFVGISRAIQNGGYDEKGDSSLEIWKNRVQKMWASHISNSNDLLQIRLIDAKTGQEIVRVNRVAGTPKGVEIVPEEELQNKASRDYFQKSLGLKKGEVYISEFSLNQEFGQIQYPFVPTVRYVTPVFDEQGELFALIAINLDVSDILTNFFDDSDEVTQVVLWDSKGDFILHPNHLLEFGSDLGHSDLVKSELHKMIPNYEKYERSGIAEGQALGKIFFAKTEIQVCPNYTLHGILFNDYEQVYSSIRRVRRSDVFLGVLFLTLAIGIGILLSYMVTKPLSQMITVLETTGPNDDLVFQSCISQEFCDIQNAIKKYRNNWIRSEKDLIEAKGEILRTEAKAEAKSSFLANMSHEIRTPMNGVMGMTQILQTTKLDAQQKECTDVIEGSANLLLTIIDDILDFSKIEAGKLAIEKIVMHPQDLVRETLALLKPQGDNKGIQMKMHIDKNVPDRVIGDPMRIRQILTNLTSNAVKFTDIGGVEIHLSSINLSARDCELIYKVIDTGVGIDPSRLKSIFNAFTQADNSITRKYGGTGLGLTISHQLATMMNGSLEVESAPGKGSTFTLVCPARVVVQGDMPHDAHLVEESNWQGSELDFSKIRLLVAEDNQVNKLVAKAILSKMGFKFDIVPNGLEAMKALEVESYDAILMDCQMPVMDGYTATKNIRTSGKPYADIPIIALTASALDTDVQRSIDSGMDAHVSKPIQVNVLQVKISRLLQPKMT